MKRYVVIGFPNLLTDWLATRKPELKEQVFVFTANVRGRIMITAASKAAETQGIFADTALADAKAIVPEVQVFDDQLGLAQKLLTRIGKWAIRFTPIVAIDLPNGLILDASGCTHLWGGENEYLQTILNRLRESGYHCRAAIADTIGAAWAIAKYGKFSPIIASNQQYNAILNLPPSALRLDNLIIQRLHKLGLNQIGKFIQM
ncbi:MAG: DNA polymerase Y family protein, partial [Acinetobacter sp.]